MKGNFTQPPELRAKKRDFLCIADLNVAEAEVLLKRAAALKKTLKQVDLTTAAIKKSVSPKKLPKSRNTIDTLAGRTLAMIFEKPSTRTRVGFEVAMTKLGGHAINLAPDDTQLGRNEPIPDTARILAGYCDCILIRTFSHDRAIELAKYSSVPVINGLTDLLHPCQVLSDVFTMKEHFGSVKGKKVAYVGDGNNMANSWIVAAAVIGFEVSIACPKGYDPDPTVLANAREGTGAKISVERDPDKAVVGADVIYTDVWASMGQEREAEARKKIFKPYQVNSRLVGLAKKGAIIMHCLPAHRGEEITDEVVEGPNSVIFPQAENRLYLQMAVLEWLMGVNVGASL